MFIAQDHLGLMAGKDLLPGGVQALVQILAASYTYQP
jgi:hypothetical protein